MSTSARPLRKDAERNRQRILEAATEVFAEQGLAVSLDAIAARAGVGVGTIYRRFPDKEQLIDALFADRVEEVAALAEAALDADDAWDGFAGFLRDVVAMHAADRALQQLLLLGEHGRERVAAGRARLKPLVEALMRRAQDAGVLRPDVVATDVPLMQIMLAAVADFTREADSEVHRRYLTILLDGLRAQPGAATSMPVGPLGDEGVDRTVLSQRTHRP